MNSLFGPSPPECKVLAEQALARGDKREASRWKVLWALDRRDPDPLVAFEVCKEAVVLLDGVKAEQDVNVAIRAWRCIGERYLATGESLQASVAWQKLAELCLQHGDTVSLYNAAIALGSAVMAFSGRQEYEKVLPLARKAFKCYARYYKRHCEPPAPEYDEKDPSTLVTLYVGGYPATRIMNPVTAKFGNRGGGLLYITADAALHLGKLETAKRDADAALALFAEAQAEKDQAETGVYMAVRLIYDANKALQKKGRSTTRTPTPRFDKLYPPAADGTRSLPEFCPQHSHGGGCSHQH